MTRETRTPEPGTRNPNYKDLLVAGWIILCCGAFFSAAWSFFGF
jgi:hypothetical protein